jgi:hypothetical protein
LAVIKGRGMGMGIGEANAETGASGATRRAEKTAACTATSMDLEMEGMAGFYTQSKRVFGLNEGATGALRNLLMSWLG